jgi:Zn-dependent peptidase ImmA (M78 family)/transcriptional regulator with XRE-family HTH domain
MNPQMLTLLRESRGMSGAQLATASGVPQPTLSKMENDRSPMTSERVEAIANALDYPVEAFKWTDPVYGFGSASFYHRKQQSLPQTTLRKVQARTNLLRMRLVRLLRGVEVGAEFQVPSIDVEELGSPADVARAVRAVWMMPMGPVKNMTVALERAGVIVMHANLESPRISAISNPGVDSTPPFILLNVGMPADRERFTLAHELGHLVMHSGVEIVEGAEAEADQFAAELLMPAAEIRTQLRGLDLAKAWNLKIVWRASIGAVIRRAFDLNQINESRYKSLNIMRTKKGWHRNEPVAFDHEPPTVVTSLVRVHLDEHGYGVDELAEVLGLHVDEFRAIYGIHDRPKKWRLQSVG